MWIDDQILEKYDHSFYSEVFVQSSTLVVLGSGNDEEREVNSAECLTCQIPVLRRYGGGGTVVLYPGCVVVSVGCWVRETYQNSLYFDLLNRAVISALSASNPVFSQLSQAGISDIVCNGRKVAGTSMFRSRNYLLYQASLLVELDGALVGRVLRHPTKEPDYRMGRSHKDFLTSLNEISGGANDALSTARCLADAFSLTARDCLDEHLIAPIDAQKAALQARLDRAGL